jgi:hypothetical protein
MLPDLRDDLLRFEGWTIREAIEACVDPALLDERDEAIAEWKALGSPRRFVRHPGVGRDLPRDTGLAGRRAFDEMRRVQLAVNEALRIALQRGRLVARSRRASPTAPSSPIPMIAWCDLQVGNQERSIVIERTREKTRHYGVRIYPVLGSPDVVDLLDGKSLKDVFHAFVLGDPQVRSLATKATAVDPTLERTYSDGFNHGYLWPLDTAMWDLAGGRYENGSVTDYIGEPLPAPEVQAAAEVLRSRYLPLLSLLKDRRLLGVGDPVRARDSAFILPAIWSHGHYYFDILQGDILQFDSESHEVRAFPYLPRWRAVTLQGPAINRRGRGPALSDQRSPRPAPAEDGGRGAEDEALRKRRTAVMTTEKAEKACRAWLVAEMENSPRHKPRPKAAFKEEALDRWKGRLSNRAFERCWADAGGITESNWSLPGAPRKSPH